MVGAAPQDDKRKLRWLARGIAIALVLVPLTANSEDKARGETWLSRIYIDGQIDTNGRASGSLETIQPVLMTALDTFFMQARAAYSDEDWTINAGLGYRYLTPDKSLLLGVNAWHDWKLENDHRRWGVGAEAIGKVLTLRGNYYGAYTGWRLIEDTPLIRIDERALSGLDAEIESQLPYMPWARLAAGVYHWDAQASDDVTGFSGRLKLDLTSSIRFESGLLAHKDETQGYFKVGIALGAPREVRYSLAETGFASSHAFDARDLSDMRLARVERNHTVVVERRTTQKPTGATSGGVVFARGT